MISEDAVVQNPVLGATILWHFVKEYCVTVPSGPVFPLLMPILPIAYNANAVSEIQGRQMVGGLFRVIAEDPAVALAIQSRMQLMAIQSFKAINVAFAADILGYEPATTEVRTRISRLPGAAVSEDDDVKKIHATAKRLGRWFAELSLEQISVLLQITF